MREALEIPTGYPPETGEKISERMGDTLHAIAELLRLNARNGFSLFAAGVSLWLLRRYQIITGDLTEMAVAYLASFGASVGIKISVEKTGGQVTKIATRRVDAARTKKAALGNLRLLQRDEFDALVWMHHKGLSRIRADHTDDPIDSLERMGLLQVEDRRLPPHDRVFIVPVYVREWLAEQVGAPEPNSVRNVPPWVETHRRM